MVEIRSDTGFTVTEVIVTLVILGLFLTLFFQIFITGQSQQRVVSQRAAANAIAVSNLNKVSTRALVPAFAAADCATTPASSSILMATDRTPSDPRRWHNSPTTNPLSSLFREDASTTVIKGLTVVQELHVQYPRGCDPTMPAKIISTVEYGGENIVHATFVK